MSSPLTVGLLRVVLHLPDSGSLKSKRQVVSGLLKRLRQVHHVAAAEGGELDRWQLAELAVAHVSGSGRDADEVVDPAAVIEWVNSLDPKPRLVVMPGVSHFFHGRLHDLRDAVIDAIRSG